MDDDNELSQQQISSSNNSNKQATDLPKYANYVIEDSDSSQVDYLHLDPNFITQAMHSVEEFPYAWEKHKNFENYCPSDAPQITENAQNFKTLLREVALTTNMLYKTFRKAYQKSKNESLYYGMDSGCKLKPSKPANVAPAAANAKTFNREIIGDTMKRYQRPAKLRASCKSNSSKLADIYIEPFTVTIPLKLLVELGSKSTPRRHKCNVCMAGKYLNRKHRSEEPKRTASISTSGKRYPFQSPFKRIDVKYQTEIKDTVINIQNSDIFLSCAPSEDIVSFTKPSIGQVRKASNVVQSSYSCKYRSENIPSLRNKIEQDIKASVIDKSNCTCMLHKDKCPNLRNKTEQFKLCNVRQIQESNYPTKANIFTAKTADAIQQIVTDVDDRSSVMNRKLSGSKQPEIPAQTLIHSQEELEDHLLEIMQQEKDTEQYKSGSPPMGDLAEMIVDVDNKTGENLNDISSESIRLLKDDTAATPQQINLPTRLDIIQIKELREFQQSIQKQLQNIINQYNDMVSETVKHGSLPDHASTSAPDKTQPQRLSPPTYLGLLRRTQNSDIETKLQADDYQKQLEDFENITSDKLQVVRKGSLIDTNKIILPSSTVEQDSNIEGNLKLYTLDQQRQEQLRESIEKVPEKISEELPEELPEEVTAKLPEKITENILGTKIQDDTKPQTFTTSGSYKELPSNKQSDGTQTDISSFSGGHAQRMILRKQILESLCYLVIPNEISNRSHLTTEDRNIILQDLWKVFSLDTLPILQDDDINAQVVEHIKYLLAYLPEEHRQGVPIDFEISDDPTIQAIIDDLRHLLYTKTLPADGHYYSKESAEAILRSLNNLLQPHSLVDTPLDQQSRKSIIYALKRLLSNGAKGREGYGNNGNEQTAVNMNASQNLSSEELSENASIQGIDMVVQQLEESELLEKLIELEGFNEEVNPNEENLNQNLSKSAIDTNDIDYEPASKRQKIDESISNVATMSTDHKNRLYMQKLDSSDSSIPENIHNTTFKVVSKDNLANETNFSRKGSLLKSADYENRNSKEMRPQINKDRYNDFISEQDEGRSSYAKREPFGFRSSATSRRRSVLPSYIPPKDYGVPRERWKPKEDYRPFNKHYEKPIKALSKTSLSKPHSKLNYPMENEKFSLKNFSRIDSEISANRLPRIRRLNKDDLNLNNEIKSNISNKSNPTAEDISTHSVALPQFETISDHSIPFNNIEAEPEIMKTLEILENSSLNTLKSANKTELIAQVSSITYDAIIRQLTDQMVSSEEDEEFDENYYIEEDIEEIEWSEVSEDHESSQTF